MKDYSDIIRKVALFDGIQDDEIASMLSCLGSKEEAYAKGDCIFHSGESVDSVGLLQSGSVLIIQEDFWGNRNILGKVMPSGIFAEAFACSADARLNVSVVADEDCSLLWLNINRILTTCPSTCARHSLMIRNLLSELAKKNLSLNEKLTHICQRTTREKLLSYLSSQSCKQGSREFDIQFNRQQLADYLSVERSALSAELSKLRNDGLIEFRKNHFVINRIK